MKDKDIDEQIYIPPAVAISRPADALSKDFFRRRTCLKKGTMKVLGRLLLAHQLCTTNTVSVVANFDWLPISTATDAYLGSYVAYVVGQ